MYKPKRKLKLNESVRFRCKECTKHCGSDSIGSRSRAEDAVIAGVHDDGRFDVCYNHNFATAGHIHARCLVPTDV